MTITQDHPLAEQWQLDGGGFRVRCLCGFEASRSSRAEALADWEGHVQVQALRKQIGRQTGEPRVEP